MTDDELLKARGDVLSLLQEMEKSLHGTKEDMPVPFEVAYAFKSGYYSALRDLRRLLGELN